jgi:hypothetical protein
LNKAKEWLFPGVKGPKVLNAPFRALEFNKITAERHIMCFLVFNLAISGFRVLFLFLNENEMEENYGYV